MVCFSKKQIHEIFDIIFFLSRRVSPRCMVMPVQTGNLAGQIIAAAQGAVMKGTHTVMRCVETPGYAVRLYNEGADKCAIDFDNTGFKHWITALAGLRVRAGPQPVSGRCSAGCSSVCLSMPEAWRGHSYIDRCRTFGIRAGSCRVPLPVYTAPNGAGAGSYRTGECRQHIIIFIVL